MTERKTVKGRILRVTVLVLVSILLLSMAMLALTKFIYDSIFPRYEYTDFENALNISCEKIEDDYSVQKVNFYSEENLLQGYVFHTPNPKGLVVISPGLSDGAEDYNSIAMCFADLGYKVFSFDTTGSFESEGDSSVGFAQAAIDLDNALDFIESDPELKSLPLFIFGHSRGGYAGAMMCAYEHNIKAVATVGGVNSPMEITLEWAKVYAGNFAATGYPALYAYQTMIFGSELTSVTAADAINLGNTPVLVIHSDNDEVVSVDGSSIYAHKDEIINPNANFMLYTKESNRGHTTLLFTKRANDYRDTMNYEYNSLLEKYNENIPKDIAQNFLNSINSTMAQEANTELITLISDFYLESLNQSK